MDKTFLNKILKTVLISIFFISIYNCDKTIKDYDVLPLLIEVPSQLKFEDSKVGSDQIAFEVKYKVSGKNAHLIEDLLHNKYGMSKLRFVCCGWEAHPDGQIEIQDKFNSRFKKLYTYNYISISMYSKETLIQKRKNWHKIPYFYVIVKVLNI